MGIILIRFSKLNDTISFKLSRRFLSCPSDNIISSSILIDRCIEELLIYIKDKTEIILGRKIFVRHRTGHNIQTYKPSFFTTIYRLIVATGKGVRLRNFNSPFYP